MGADCLFCRIAAGQTPAWVVWQDDWRMVFLDHRPLFPGHCLLIPKSHYEDLVAAPADAIAALFVEARLFCAAIEQAMDAEGSFVAVNNRVSQSVPHLHVHLVPRRRKDGLRGFFWPRGKYRDDAHAIQVRDAIRNVVQRLKEPRAHESSVNI